MQTAEIGMSALHGPAMAVAIVSIACGVFSSGCLESHVALQQDGGSTDSASGDAEASVDAVVSPDEAVVPDASGDVGPVDFGTSPCGPVSAPMTTIGGGDVLLVPGPVVCDWLTVYFEAADYDTALGFADCRYSETYDEYYCFEYVEPILTQEQLGRLCSVHDFALITCDIFEE